MKNYLPSQESTDIGNKMTKILVTGGCGYVGSVLIPELLESNHAVKVVDAQWFGNNLPPHPNLEILKKTVEDISTEDLNGIEIVIHLANVANDPSVELNPSFSWEVNVLHTNLLLEKCKKTKSIRKFVYASSGSVYGVRPEERVTEEVDLTPISIYNKTKMSTERVVLSFQGDFETYSIRPATVCGVSPRMRFDVVVNMFVLQAYTTRKINVFGGKQVRPNIHIRDMARVYKHFIGSEGIPSGAYNAGFENLLVSDIAEQVATLFDAEIHYSDSNDPRSYRQDSSKLLGTGFRPEFQVSDAIKEISEALQSGHIKDTPNSHTVGWMKQNKIGIN
jgi:nucleoside-diphosphate-sugar epimerase